MVAITSHIPIIFTVPNVLAVPLSNAAGPKSSSGTPPCHALVFETVILQMATFVSRAYAMISHRRHWGSRSAGPCSPCILRFGSVPGNGAATPPATVHVAPFLTQPLPLQRPFFPLAGV